MSTVRGIVLLLSIISSGLCFANERANPVLPPTDSVLSQGPDGSFHFHILPSRGAQRQFSVGPFSNRAPANFTLGMGGIGCYSIHSYKTKRIDNTDQTVAAGETTCTPSSHVRFKPVQPVSETDR